MASYDELKKDVFDYIQFRLGASMVDVELDPSDMEQSLKRSIEVYRTRASNSEEESYSFMEMQENVQEYTLPQEIQFVRQIFRRTIGSSSNSAANQFEPFEAGYINTYLLKVGRTGGLLSYELYTDYQKLSARMFGGFVNFTFNPVTKKLVIVRRPQASGEILLLWTYNLRPEIQLLSDIKIKTWLKDYSYSLCKYALGEARSKFGTIVGPQGGTQLNGAELKNEAKDEMEKLHEDLRNYRDGSSPAWWIIG